MYTIKRAAELTGVQAATLRAWERRYDLVEPQRTDAGYRLYDEESLSRIRGMAALLEDGWTASQAAAEVSRRRHASEAAQPPPPATAPPSLVAPSPASTPGSSATTRFIAAAASLDPAAVAAVLDEQFALTSFEAVVDGWLMPALDEVGRAWADGRISVAGEHLTAHAVMRRLATAYDAAASRLGGPTVIVGLPAGAQHELGIFAFSVALRRRGVKVVYLGPDLPATAWDAAAKTHASACAVLSVPREQDLPATHEVIATLAAHQENLAIFVGGNHQADLTDTSITTLGHTIAPAAARVAAAVARDETTKR